MKNLWVPSLVGLIGIAVGFFAAGFHHPPNLVVDKVMVSDKNFTVSRCSGPSSTTTIPIPPASELDLTKIVCGGDTVDWKGQSTSTFSLEFDSTSCFGGPQFSSTNGDITKTALYSGHEVLQVCKYKYFENGALKYDPHIIIIDGK